MMTTSMMECRLLSWGTSMLPDCFRVCSTHLTRLSDAASRTRAPSLPLHEGPPHCQFGVPRDFWKLTSEMFCVPLPHEAHSQRSANGSIRNHIVRALPESYWPMTTMEDERQPRGAYRQRRLQAGPLRTMSQCGLLAARCGDAIARNTPRQSALELSTLPSPL